MSQRDSKPSLPNTARYYIKSQWTVFNARVFVQQSSLSRFKVLSDELVDNGYDAENYAYTVSNMLKRWVMEHKFRCIPVNIFTGEWTLKKYKKVAKQQTVEIVSNETDELVYSEMLVAQKYIESKGLRKLPEIVDELFPLLSSKWIKLYEDHTRDELVYKVLDMLCEDYGIQCSVSSYNDIIKVML